MTIQLKHPLWVAIVSFVLVLAMASLTWWVYTQLRQFEVRLTETQTDLYRTGAELSASQQRLKDAEKRLLSLTSSQGALGEQLVTLQRSAYDHEKMLCTMFSCERSGRSIVSFRKQSQPRRISIQVGQ